MRLGGVSDDRDVNKMSFREDVGLPSHSGSLAGAGSAARGWIGLVSTDRPLMPAYQGANSTGNR